MTTPYPLQTRPFFRNYLWGGRKLQTVLGKDLPPVGSWAESWEIIDHPEHQSEITNGPLAGHTLRDLTASDPDWLLGTSPQRPQSIPLLLKYLDCQRVLSVQVHPDDAYALQMNPPDLGKSEAWYIVAAEEGSKLYAGLRQNVGPQELQQAMAAGRVEECLHELQPQAGDCVFIPAGTVHALGAGLLVAEIQQASNTTFRLFDWNRLDASGQPRELHVEKALEVIDFQSGPRPLQQPQPAQQPGREHLVQCDKFVLDRLRDQQLCKVGGDDRFHFLTVPSGSAQLSWQDATGNHTKSLAAGQSVLLPASMPDCQLELFSNSSVALDMYLP